jgi:hypothetical protein
MVELVVKRSFEDRRYDNSHESLITPYEDMNIQQQRITGERFPDIILSYVIIAFGLVCALIIKAS